MSFLFVVVSGNNTEKNMEACEQMIRDMKLWLREDDKLASEVTRQQLARLETSKRVLRHIRLRNETDTHNETYLRVCITFLDNIILSISTAVISKATDDMSQGKSDLPEILRSRYKEIKSYLRKLDGKIGKVDLVINEIEGKVSYFLKKR